MIVIMFVIVPIGVTLQAMASPAVVGYNYLLLEGAKWLKANTGKDTIAAGYSSGILGYFSERHVINLDGLANSKDFSKELASEGLGGYLEKEGVEYFVILQPGNESSAFENLEVVPVQLPENVSGLEFYDRNDSEVQARALRIYRLYSR